MVVPCVWNRKESRFKKFFGHSQKLSFFEREFGWFCTIGDVYAKFGKDDKLFATHSIIKSRFLHFPMKLQKCLQLQQTLCQHWTRKYLVIGGLISVWNPNSTCLRLLTTKVKGYWARTNVEKLFDPSKKVKKVFWINISIKIEIRNSPVSAVYWSLFSKPHYWKKRTNMTLI